MTSRKRLRDFLAGKRVDRIPNGFGGCETAGLHVLAYQQLKDLLSIDGAAPRLYTFMSNTIFEPEVLSRIGGDMVIADSGLCRASMWDARSSDEWKEIEIWNTRVQVPVSWRVTKSGDGSLWLNDTLRCPPGGYYFDLPPEDEGDPADAPSPDDFHPAHEIPDADLRRIEDNARWLHDNTEFSIVCGETVRDLQYKPGGTVAWWMRMATEPNACHDFLYKMVEASLAQLKQLDQAVGKYCDTLLIADDMGDDRGVTIGPDLWREVYKPHYMDLFRSWHEITNMKVLLHDCGAIADILGDLIECGVDIINPVQTSAHGMSPETLKAKFGSRLIFYGGAYDRVSFSMNQPEDVVYEQVKKNIEVLSENGGYIFAGVHNLPADTPQSHLKAMLAAYEDCAELPQTEV